MKSKTTPGRTRRLFVLVLSFLLVWSVVNIGAEYAYADTTGYVNASSGVNVREGAGTEYSKITAIAYKTTVTILDETKASDGTLWYKIKTGSYTGYVCAQYITVNEASADSGSESSEKTKDDSSGDSSGTGSDVSYSSDGDFEAYLTAQGFPESYKPYLRELHAKYPNWKFVALKTGLDWDEVIYTETHPASRNLVPSNWSDRWKSVDKSAYNLSTGTYTIFDSGGYVAASEQTVAYYMDPRNSLSERSIFQFLSNKYDSSTQKASGVSSLVSGSFMTTYPESDYASYADLFVAAGKTYGVNPLTLASIVLNEQGSAGSSSLISGTVSGYEGYYNFFNVGAYMSGGRSAVTNGLIYAKNHGWYGRAKAIMGGTEVYANNYVNRNKTSVYLMKFNVMNGMSSVGTGQYMTAVYAANNEGLSLYEGYSSLLSNALTFEIPVYNDMPSSACAAPTGYNNNYYLKTLTAGDYSLTPTYSAYTTEYEITVPNSQSQIKISATPYSSYSSVSGTGTHDLAVGDNTIKVTCTASSGVTKTYTIVITRQKAKSSDSTSSKKSTETDSKKSTSTDSKTTDSTDEKAPSSSVYTIGETLAGLTPQTSYEDFMKNISMGTGSAKLYSSDGEEVKSGCVGTGMVLKLYDSTGKELSSSTVILKGDNNGDGKVNTGDAIRIQKYVIKTQSFDDAYLQACDINGDGKYNTGDAILIQKYVIKTYNISF